MAIQGINGGISLNFYNNVNQATQRNLRQIASGKRINSAADDASGLAVSKQMEAQTTGYTVGMQNADNGMGLIRTSESALNEVSGILGRMQELGLRANSGLYDDTQKAMLQKEFDYMSQEIDRIAQYTNYNGIRTLNGSTAEEGTDINVGGEAATRVPGFDMTARGLGVESLNIEDTESVDKALKSISEAQTRVASARGDYGAIYNGLEHTKDSLDAARENTEAARSEIEDADVVRQIMDLKRNNTLSAIQNALADLSKQNQFGILRWVQQ